MGAISRQSALDSARATLEKAGIANPARLVSLVFDAVHKLKLDLTGLTVITEAASGSYVVTPVIALAAGATRVLALTSDSPYAPVEHVVEQTRALELLAEVRGRTEIHAERDPELFARVDLVTNLGFVRPIDRTVLARMPAGAVIALMCEAWEYRAEDLDLAACCQMGVRVVATNEDFPGVDVFSYSGWLSLKLLFDAGIEIHKSRLVVVSTDKFGLVIERRLQANGIEVRRVERLDHAAAAGADAVIIADYSRQDLIIGDDGDIDAATLARVAPATTVIQFAGRVCLTSLRREGIAVFPNRQLPARRMSKTLAHLGPRPVVELHAAGLKVGEIALRDPSLRDPHNGFVGLAQPMLQTDRTKRANSH